MQEIHVKKADEWPKVIKNQRPKWRKMHQIEQIKLIRNT